MKIDFVLICILWGVYVCNQNNTIISSFYPQFALTRFGIQELIVGFIFSAHPVGVFASSLILAKLMNKQGMKKNCSILGMIIQALSSGIFIFLKYLDDEIIFIVVSVLARIFMGIGQGLFCTPSYSYLPVLYGDDLERVIAFIEASAGIGLSLGPLFGGIIFDALGYESIFFFNMIVSLIIIPFQMKFMPYQVDKKDHNFQIEEVKVSDFDGSPKTLTVENNRTCYDQFNSENQNQGIQQKLSENIGQFDSNKQTEEIEKIASQQGQSSIKNNELEESFYEFEINYRELLSHLNIVFSCILVFIPTALTGFLDPCLGPYALEEYGLDEFVIGMVFFAGAGLYILMLPVSTLLTKKTKQYKRMLFVGSFLSGGSMLIISPGLGIPHTKYFLFIGQAILNIGNALIYIPVIPDMIQTLQKIYPEEDEGIMGDLSSALYNSSFALGYFFGPAVGGLLVTLTSFPTTSFYLGALLVTFAVLYLVFGGVLIKKHKEISHSKSLIPQIFISSKIKQQKLLSGSIISSRSVRFNLNQRKQSTLSFNKVFQDSLLQDPENNLKQSLQSDGHLARPISQIYKHGPLVKLKKEIPESTVYKIKLSNSAIKNRSPAESPQRKNRQQPFVMSYQE